MCEDLLWRRRFLLHTVQEVGEGGLCLFTPEQTCSSHGMLCVFCARHWRAGQVVSALVCRVCRDPWQGLLEEMSPWSTCLPTSLAATKQHQLHPPQLQPFATPVYCYHHRGNWSTIDFQFRASRSLFFQSGDIGPC